MREGGHTTEVFLVRSWVGSPDGGEEVDGGELVRMLEMLRPDEDGVFVLPA
jgi:hypothetical protein